MNKSLTEAIAEIEVRQKALAEKMTEKITELEQQIGTLEKFLANTEIEYAAGEIDEELRERESSALTLGLEAAKQQLDVIKEAMADLFPGEAKLVSPPQPVETGEKTKKEKLETPLEPQIETPVEVQEKVEPVTEEETYEQPVEALATDEEETSLEMPVEETLTDEESFSSPEESVEETASAETSESADVLEAAENEATAEEAALEGEEEETEE